MPLSQAKQQHRPTDPIHHSYHASSNNTKRKPVNTSSSSLNMKINPLSQPFESGANFNLYRYRGSKILYKGDQENRGSLSINTKSRMATEKACNQSSNILVRRNTKSIITNKVIGKTYLTIGTQALQSNTFLISSLSKELKTIKIPSKASKSNEQKV